MPHILAFPSPLVLREWRDTKCPARPKSSPPRPLCSPPHTRTVKPVSFCRKWRDTTCARARPKSPPRTPCFPSHSPSPQTLVPHQSPFRPPLQHPHQVLSVLQSSMFKPLLFYRKTRSKEAPLLERDPVPKMDVRCESRSSQRPILLPQQQRLRNDEHRTATARTICGGAVSGGRSCDV